MEDTAGMGVEWKLGMGTYDIRATYSIRRVGKHFEDQKKERAHIRAVASRQIRKEGAEKGNRPAGERGTKR